MREDKDGVRCDLGFGKTGNDVLARCASSLAPVKYVGINNPMPTGDHWKMISWIADYQRKGPFVLTRVPPARRDFIKRAAAILAAGDGFWIEIASMAARKFRDDNDLRMQRGKVFAFVSLLPREIDESIERIEGTSFEDQGALGQPGLDEPADRSIPSGDPSTGL